MPNKKIFQEVQHFLPAVLKWMLCVAFVVLVIARWDQFRTLDSAQLLPLSLPVLLLALLCVVQLRTKIDRTAIVVTFVPFVWNRKILWADLAAVEVKKYSLFDTGGWGYRFGKVGMVYSTRGRQGLELTFRGGKKLLIGTQRAVELRQFLDEIRKEKSL